MICTLRNFYGGALKGDKIDSVIIKNEIDRQWQLVTWETAYPYELFKSKVFYNKTSSLVWRDDSISSSTIETPDPKDTSILIISENVLSIL